MAPSFEEQLIQEKIAEIKKEIGDMETRYSQEELMDLVEELVLEYGEIEAFQELRELITKS